MKKKEQVEKSKGINILKFICSIIIACIYHYKNDFPVGNLFEKNTIIRGMSNYGFLLVELFFIISGYLFYISYNNKIKNNKKDFNTFIKQRYVRLIPLAALTSIIMFVLENVHYKLYKTYWIFTCNSIVDLIYQVTGIQHWTKIQGPSLNNAIWYISVLLLCYIIYFFVTKLEKRMGNLIYIYCIVIFTILMTYGINIPFFNYYTLRGLLSFGIGIIIGIVVQNNDIKKLSNISVIILAITIGLTLIFKKEIMGYLPLYLNFVIYPCLLIIVLRIDFLLEKIDIKFTELLANISFGIYLWNLPLQLFFHLMFGILKIKIDYSNVYICIIQIIIHIIIGILSYKFIEKKLKTINLNIKGF